MPVKTIGDSDALKLLKAYREYLDKQSGYYPKVAPSYLELAGEVGISSTSGLASRWKRLEKMGLVVCIRRGSRCYWRLTPKGMTYDV